MAKNWWDGYPWRMIQTNFREIDMEDVEAEKYASDLQDFGITVVTLNSAGILASYDTKHPFHPKSQFLHGSSLKELVEACHRHGIRVIARTDFSKVHVDIYEQHPEWAYKTPEGEIVNYNGDVQMCPNGDYQQKYMFEIITETLSEIPFDGLFCNMSGFQVRDYHGRYYGPCHCENCVSKFKAEYGLDIPDTDEETEPAYLAYLDFKKKVTIAHKEKMQKVVKAIRPDICLNRTDYYRSESSTEMGREQWAYSASSNSRLYAGRNRVKVSDNACVDFIGFRYREISVSPAQMELRQWQNLANSGAVSIYIMGRLDNHKDRSSLEPTKKVFQFHKKHEDFYLGQSSLAEVMLLRTGGWGYTEPELKGWVNALSESHVPFDQKFLLEVTDTKDLEPYKVVICPDFMEIKPAQKAILEEYAEKGGTILATGRTELGVQGIEDILEVRDDAMSAMFVVSDEEQSLFPNTVEAPYIAPGPHIYVYKPQAGVKTYLHMVDEHPFGPPERCYFTEKDVTNIPGILENKAGKGRVITVACRLGAMYANEGYLNSLNLMRDLMALCGMTSWTQDATPMFEVNLTKKDDLQVLHLVNTTGVFENRFFDPIPLNDIELQVPFDFSEVTTLNGGRVTVEGRKVILDKLDHYEAICFKA